MWQYEEVQPLEGDLGLEGGVLVTGINAFLRDLRALQPSIMWRNEKMASLQLEKGPSPESNSVGTLISVFILYGILLQDPEQTRTFLKRKDKTYH
jgi:hypothetical protein